VPLPLFVVDAFTGRPFAGNPAAVCLLDRPRPDDWMQQLAAEMNLSETAFLHAEGDGHRLRWFTPAVEVDLCGHATLASAHVLWETGSAPPGRPLRFHTRSGLLTATPDGAWIELDFPALPVRRCDPPAGLAESLGVPLTFVGSYGLDYLCEVADEPTLRTLTPDLARLGALQTRGVIVTCRPQGGDYDFVSRFFAPAVGIPEDPVTGSAHCALGPYWSAKLGRADLQGYQASRRGGVVRVRVGAGRVRLGGQAVTVLRGELLP
jgi:predicted PhzF superfamily epimerase YddE/YHI9